MTDSTKRHIKDVAASVIIMVLAFGASLILDSLHIDEHITTVFVFAVFIISLITDGYIYGIVTALIATVAINFAFTFPYFAFNFTIPENFLSALIMTIISLMTSALTTKIKHWQELKAEGEREKMRANLLRAVSHDLRTPLTTIYGSSSAILENAETLTDAQKTRMINGIKEDSEWLIRMVENLLSITRIDSGNVKLIKTPIVLDELIDSVLIKLRKRYSDIAVKTNLPDDVVLIPMDALLIEQVLINILENAIHHATGMTLLSLTVNVSDGKAVFKIEDNGCGIPKERLDGLFKGTYSPDGHPTDTKGAGAGIGLSVCAAIIHAHGGEISAENLDTGGALFRFTLGTKEVDL